MRSIFFFLLCLLSLPGICQEDEEAFLQRMEKDRLQQIQRAAQLDQMREGVEDQTLDLVERMKGLGHNSFSGKALLDEEVQHMLQEVLRNNPLRNLPRDEVTNLILERVQGRPAEKLFRRFPKVLDIIVSVFQDANALPALVGILKRSEDLKFYGYVWIGLIVFSFLFKKIVFSKDWSFFKRFGASFVFGLSMTALSFGIFYYLFSREIGPTLSVVLRSL